MQPTNPQRPSPANQRPQFFDVVRPGRTPASPNSRPVLPNKQPAVPDTSMKMGAPAVPPGLLRQQPMTSTPQPASVQPPIQPTISRPAPAPSVTQPQTFSRPVAPVATPPIVQQAPVVQPANPVADQPEPGVADQPKPHQKHSFWSEFFAIFAILLLVGVIFNILLDAEIINLPVPHTNFFDY